MPIDATTQLVGVVGHPVSHSLSPAFWNPALQDAGRNAVFLGFDVEPNRFEPFIDGMLAAGTLGLNVTMPHKDAAFRRADGRSAEAEGTGAVNVLVFASGRVTGHNTDVAGVLRALRDIDGEDLMGATALVLGAGGAGRAACWALRAAGAEVLVANRTAERADGLAGAMGIATAPWDDLPLRDVDLVIHATTMGLRDEDSPLTPGQLAEAAGARLRTVLDVVYRPGETALVRLAREAGIVAADGLAMLVHQAAEAWTLFFGDPAPIQVMMDAANVAAERSPRPGVRKD